MNRFAIVEGHYCFYSDYHRGQSDWMYARLAKIATYYVRRNSSMDEESWDVYDALLTRYKDSQNSKKSTSVRGK